MKLTAEEIEAGKSETGGFTKATLAEWGIDWPPPSGWKDMLMRGDVFEAYVPEPVSDEDELWSRELCVQHQDDPDRMVGAPLLPLWRSYLTYARHAKNTAKVIKDMEKNDRV